jgi:chemotaxis protein CheD
MTAVAARKTQGADRKLFLVQGEFRVSNEVGLVVSTTLGSCVATCLYDPQACVGGINHFLLPHGEAFQGPDAVRYGAHAMELLINGMLHAGAKKSRLVAKLFGGARLSEYLPDVGGANVAFAEHFLRHEGIVYLGGSTGGAAARRIEFWPESGRARQREIPAGDREVLHSERFARPAPPEAGSIEFFEN